MCHQGVTLTAGKKKAIDWLTTQYTMMMMDGGGPGSLSH